MTLHRFWIRRWLVLATIVAGLSLVVGSAGLVTATLSPSTFNAGDGNLVDSDGGKDWNSSSIGIDCTSTPKKGCALDKPTGATDDSFGGGTDEDEPNPKVVAGSIPPNKSDLTRFYIATEKVTGNDFLYLAWERVQEPSGTTNMDFEFNQKQCPPDCSDNAVTPVRTAGDILIKYDLSQGGTVPTLGYHIWKTTAGQTGTNPTCQAGNKLPCWDAVHSLTGNFEGSVNSVSTVDPIPPGPRTLSARTFGEAAVNLQGAGIFTTGQCESFGSAYLKSRSSDSFNSEIKDFIAPLKVNVSNCGSIIIRKVTDPSSDTTSFTYAAGGGLSPTSFTLTGGGTPRTYSNVQAGSGYNVTETLPSGWDLTSLTCTASSGSSGTQDGGNPLKVNISLAAQGTVDCTYTNTKRPTLTVNKVLVPSSDPGKFNLQIDGVTKATDVGNNGTTGAQVVSIGSHTVGEIAGTGTSLSDYDTVIGGDCAANGSVSLAAGDNKTCTITNTRKTGAIKVTKQSIKGNSGLAGATFEIRDTTPNKNLVATLTTAGSDGTACKDNLSLGSYTVTETAAPSGYKIDDASAVSVSVTQSAACGSGSEAAPAVFKDTPLSTITVSFDSLAGTSTTATIQCTGDANPVNLPEGSPRTLGDGTTSLVPGTYTCTVVIDP